MIPKKIHYCWFSGDPYPPIVLQCMETWRDQMPDFELVLWDYDKVKNIDSIWLQECLRIRKWAFAADFIRLWAVYHEGGIYLDSDVMVFQSFSHFLSEQMFIGREGMYYTTLDEGIQVFLTSHCFGSECGNSFIKLCLDYYSGRHFICSDQSSIPILLRYDMMMMPYIQSRLAELFGYDTYLYANHIQHLTNGVSVYPDTFFGMGYGCKVTKDTYAQHVGQGSWRELAFFEQKRKALEANRNLRERIKNCIVHVVRYIGVKLGYAMIKI